MYWVENSVKTAMMCHYLGYKKEKIFLLNCLLKDSLSSEKALR